MNALPLFIAGLLLAADPAVETAAPLRVENAWVREAPPGAEVLAAYAMFCNDSEAAVALVGARSEDFGTVEMHATVETNGAVTMRRLQSVVVGPMDCVAFEPGGRHFMLLEPKRAVRAGDEVAFTLALADGNEVAVAMPVRRGAAVEHHHHHGHAGGPAD